MHQSNLDANIVLRIVLDDVPEQAYRAARYIDRTPCYVSDIVIAECVFVLETVYKLDRKTIVLSMENFLELKTVFFNETLIEQTFSVYAASRKLSFADCYSLVEAAMQSNTLITFDRAILKKAGFTAKEP